jgi:hypothetical protein
MAVSVTGLTANLVLGIVGHMAQTETFATSPEIKSHLINHILKSIILLMIQGHI